MSRIVNLIIGGLFFCFPIGITDAGPAQNYNVAVSGTVRDTVVTFIGYSSPNAFITVQEDGAIVGTLSANSSGGFNESLTARIPGTHSYGIFAQDSNNRLTPTYGFILSLMPETETVVSNILLPTTIDVAPGSPVQIIGATTPSNQVTIFVHSNPFTENDTAGADGTWDHPITTYMDPGAHRAYADVSMSNGLQSIDSNTVNFNVSCKIADLNCDGKVNLVDFSILMYYWGTNNTQADINQDGTVDLTDFSIMMFYWDG